MSGVGWMGPIIGEYGDREHDGSKLSEEYSCSFPQGGYLGWELRRE